MTTQQHSGSRLPPNPLDGTPRHPPDAELHEEWLLDEARTEAFPASDAIAVSPYGQGRPLRTISHGSAGKAGVTGENADCGDDYDTPSEALQTAIECEYCQTGVPATTELSFEGADNIYHF